MRSRIRLAKGEAKCLAAARDVRLVASKGVRREVAQHRREAIRERRWQDHGVDQRMRGPVAMVQLVLIERERLCAEPSAAELFGTEQRVEPCGRRAHPYLALEGAHAWGKLP